MDPAIPGTSFGVHRCQLVAEALWSGYEEGIASPAARVVRVEDAFRAQGLDPRRPYLGGGGSGEAALQGLKARWRVTRPPQPSRRRPSGPPLSLLDGAVSIGRRLCAEAHAFAGRCTWIAAAVDDWRDSGAQRSGRVTTIGSDLYSGNAGVGLFLALLASVTGDQAFRATAQAALQKALAGISQCTDLSFHSGTLGIAWCAVRVGTLLGDAELLERGAALLDTATASSEGPLDVIGGHAGAILALLALDDAGPRRALALRLGRQLCEAALAQEQGAIAWEPRGMHASRPLTGYGHGVAGQATALAALGARLGDEALLDTARRAFAHEDACYDERSRNWPDFRIAHADDPPGNMVAWCHGAAGVGLSRAHLRTLGLSSLSTDEALPRALAATRRMLRKARRDWDRSLCHGSGGWLETLLAAGYREEVQETWREWLRSWDGRVIPSGLRSRAPHPSLMLGSAGVGYALLRAAFPDDIKSVLVPQ